MKIFSIDNIDNYARFFAASEMDKCSSNVYVRLPVYTNPSNIARQYTESKVIESNNVYIYL